MVWIFSSSQTNKHPFLFFLPGLSAHVAISGVNARNSWERFCPERSLHWGKDVVVYIGGVFLRTWQLHKTPEKYFNCIVLPGTWWCRMKSEDNALYSFIFKGCLIPVIAQGPCTRHIEKTERDNSFEGKQIMVCCINSHFWIALIWKCVLFSELCLSFIILFVMQSSENWCWPGWQ